MPRSKLPTPGLASSETVAKLPEKPTVQRSSVKASRSEGSTVKGGVVEGGTVDASSTNGHALAASSTDGSIGSVSPVAASFASDSDADKIDEISVAARNCVVFTEHGLSIEQACIAKVPSAPCTDDGNLSAPGRLPFVAAVCTVDLCYHAHYDTLHDTVHVTKTLGHAVVLSHAPECCLQGWL